MNQSRPSSALASLWEHEFRRYGFVLGEGIHSFNGISALASERWLVLEASPSFPKSKPPGFESPGLWKRIRPNAAERLLFEFPAAVIDPHGEDESLEADENSTPRALLSWATSTATGHVLAAWKAPARDLVESWMPPGALTVQVGPFVRQGELLLEPTRWALRFALLPVVSRDLPKPRHQCLKALAVDAQSRWRMARVALVRDPAGDTLLAGINLAGAPHSPALFLASLDSLRNAVAGLVETAELLADVNVALRSVEVCIPKHEREKGNTHEHGYCRTGSADVAPA